MVAYSDVCRLKTCLAGKRADLLNIFAELQVPIMPRCWFCSPSPRIRVSVMNNHSIAMQV